MERRPVRRPARLSRARTTRWFVCIILIRFTCNNMFHGNYVVCIVCLCVVCHVPCHVSAPELKSEPASTVPYGLRGSAFVYVRTQSGYDGESVKRSLTSGQCRRVGAFHLLLFRARPFSLSSFVFDFLVRTRQAYAVHCALYTILDARRRATFPSGS